MIRLKKLRIGNPKRKVNLLVTLILRTLMSRFVCSSWGTVRLNLSLRLEHRNFCLASLHSASNHGLCFLLVSFLLCLQVVFRYSQSSVDGI
jgi:hypothetical protein